jgi:PKD repeat protein
MHSRLPHLALVAPLGALVALLGACSESSGSSGQSGGGGTPPGAMFSASPTAGTAPLGVQFTDLSSGVVSGWSWDFGDGGSSTVASPFHVYLQPGSYTVGLAVDGPGGSDQDSQPDYIVVDAPPPPCPAPSGSGFTRVPDVPFAPSGRALDVYLPDLPRTCSPTVVWIHGGGSTGGAKDDVFARGVCEALAADGWFSVSIDYALSTFEPCAGGAGQGSYPEAILDAKLAVDWVHASGTILFGLSDRVVAAGSSAGGQLAALLAATQGAGEGFFDPSPQADVTVELAVLVRAPTNLVAIGCRGHSWSPPCDLVCPAGPPNDPCAPPVGCVDTGGYPAGYPCASESGGCFDATAVESALGEIWPAGGAPLGVDCADPLALPPGVPGMPTGIAWYDASAYFWLSGEEPPIFVHHAECDPLVPSSQALELSLRLAQLGVPAVTAIEPAAASCGAGCQHGEALFGVQGTAERVAQAILAVFAP